jgi:hypothetical protein
MRFMLLLIPSGEGGPEPAALPDAQTIAAMIGYTEALQDAGVLVTLDGLHPPSSGARVRFHGGKATVSAGPFGDAKETLGGYWMIDVGSCEDAIAWASRCPAADHETIEVRQVQAPTDFPRDLRDIASKLARLQGDSIAQAVA